MIRTLTLSALAIAFITPTLVAQQTQQTQQGQTQQTQQGQQPVNDSLFAAAAADSGIAEVTLSQLGEQRATDPELKRFSRQMINEHTRGNQELQTLAAQKGIALPATVDVRAQYCAESLAGLTGQKFDECYAKAQLTAHLEAVSAFEAEAERGQDRDVKALAARTLPHIKEHLNMIKPIAMRFEKEKGDSPAHSSSGNR